MIYSPKTSPYTPTSPYTTDKGLGFLLTEMFGHLLQENGYKIILTNAFYGDRKTPYTPKTKPYTPK